LRFGKIRIRSRRVGARVAGVADLDADRDGVDVRFGLPDAFSGMPGAGRFRHHLDDGAILTDHVMRGNLAVGIGEPGHSALGGRHAGVMQHDAIKPLAILARAEIGRGDDDIRQRRIGGKSGLHLPKILHRVAIGAAVGIIFHHGTAALWLVCETIGDIANSRGGGIAAIGRHVRPDILMLDGDCFGQVLAGRNGEANYGQGEKRNDTHDKLLPMVRQAQ
jgi:hypothetical protein